MLTRRIMVVQNCAYECTTRKSPFIQKMLLSGIQFIRQTEIVMKKTYLKRLVWWWFGVLLLLRRAVPMVTVLKPVLYPRRAGTMGVKPRRVQVTHSAMRWVCLLLLSSLAGVVGVSGDLVVTPVHPHRGRGSGTHRVRQSLELGNRRRRAVGRWRRRGGSYTGRGGRVRRSAVGVRGPGPLVGADVGHMMPQ